MARRTNADRTASNSPSHIAGTFDGSWSLTPDIAWQPSLFAAGETVAIDRSFSTLRRIDLDQDSWVDHVPGWITGADRLFEEVLAGRNWEQRSRRMYDQRVREPRDSVGFNLYRDGRDSVAWHADRIAKEIEDPIVALISLGEPRRFLLRPKGGGASRAFVLGRGDLLVTCGRTQRSWEHRVPKVARAGPRISLAYRHDMDPSVYAAKRAEESRED